MKRPLDTRNFIIQKSAELFNRLGYEGCALSDIMEATQLKKGGIYNHFRNKDEIALEAFDYSFQQVISYFRKGLDHAKSPRDKLYVLLDRYAQMAKKPVIPGGCPIFNTAVDAQNTHPLLKQKAKEGIAMLQRYIELKIEEGEAIGEFSCRKSPAELAMLIVIQMEGAIIFANTFDQLDAVHISLQFMKDCLDHNLIIN